MSAEEIKTIVRKITEELYKKGNIDAIDKYYVTQFVRHRPPYPKIEGLSAFKQFVTDLRRSYPDLHVEIKNIIVEGNIAVIQGTWGGTQKGKSPTTGVEPTGKQVTVPICMVTHFEDSKIVEEWMYTDYLGLLQQLGVISEDLA